MVLNKNLTFIPATSLNKTPVIGYEPQPIKLCSGTFILSFQMSTSVQPTSITVMTMLSVITLRDLINARVALGTMEMEHLAPVNYHGQCIFQKRKTIYFNSLIFFLFYFISSFLFLFFFCFCFCCCFFLGGGGGGLREGLKSFLLQYWNYVSWIRFAHVLF